MKKIVCEVCGASDIIKMDGLFVCQSCGTKYSLEEARKLMAEGTATNDTNNDIQNFLKRAFMHLEEGSWKQADELLDQILNKAPENTRAYLGKLMVQLKVKHEDQIKKLPISLQNNTNYKRILQFGDKELIEKITYIGNDIVVDNFDEVASSKNDLVYKDSKIVVITENMQKLAFYCKYIEKAIILDGVTDIPDSAFEKCTSLKTINIPNSVTSIGDKAFIGCKSIKNIIIPDSVTSIGNSAFSYCTSLETINIPNSVTSIGGGAFESCTSLKTINIPNSVTSIGCVAFKKCSSLESITIPNLVTSIGDYTFCFCNSLKQINIPDLVRSIGNNAFYECTSLESINIPDSVTSIGDGAFNLCTSLKTINIPNSVRSIGNNAFYKCTSLESINIPNSVTSIGCCAFEVCTSLKSINIPNSVTSIGNNAFVGCSSLERITVSKFVKLDNWYALNIQNVHIEYEGTTEEWKKLNVYLRGSLHCADTDEKERRKKMEIMNRRINAGLCRHCGGSFKGVFSKECKDCGRKKDY